MSIVGIGPGDPASLSERARKAIEQSRVIAGYRTYIRLLGDLAAGKEIVSSGMTQEIGRAKEAIRIASGGKEVCLISSGDPGIYGMAGLILELLTEEERKRIRIEILPGITSASSCAALLGAPLMNDFAVISLSDLLTDLRVIGKRVKAACEGDFVIVFYNPKSKRRIKPFEKAWQTIMKYRSPQTPVGIVRNAGRGGERVVITCLKDMLLSRQVDMAATVIVGNSNTFVKGKYMITPRGYEL